MLTEFIKEPFLGFDQNSVDFLGKLKNKKYNNKKWFDKNRDTYELHVKLPMRHLIDSLAQELKNIDERIFISNKSIMRINRDIRFKKDKTPYKTVYAAAFTYDRIKSPEIPLFYIHLSSDEFLFAAGQYSTDNGIIKKIRNHIFNDFDDFLSIVTDDDLIGDFGSLHGESLHRLPREYSGLTLDGEMEKYLKMKQLYVEKYFSPDIAFDPDLTDVIVRCVRLTNKLNKFLYDSL
ncbi:MAG: DUF2461 domain-containing protein [Ignavibacteria bacterium]